MKRLAFAGVALLGVVLGSTAYAADRIYWGDSAADVVSFANADGSGDGGDVVAPGASISCPYGTAVDLAAGRIYWAGCGSSGISFGDLDGTGGGDLNTTGGTPDDVAGVTIDPATGRIYWASRSPNAVSFFPGTGGAGGADFDTTGATVSSPAGVALDLAGGRLFWGNESGNKISFAALDGGDGGDLDTTGATVDGPQGVAIDPVAGRVYWANYNGNKISFAALDGSGGSDLETTGAMVSGPIGIAIDHDAGRIYWANYNGGKLSVANLDGSGGRDLDVSGATSPPFPSPGFPVLVQSPRPSTAPAISGGTEPGAVLSCSDGTWAPDVLGAFLYRVPTSLAYQWSRDGADVAGATSASYTAFVAGDYRCKVTASNVAGATDQTSEPHAVTLPAVPPTECTVPAVVGRTLDDAAAALAAGGCSVGKVKRRRSSAEQIDVVLALKPKPGKVLALGAKVKLVVGRGGKR